MYKTRYLIIVAALIVAVAASAQAAPMEKASEADLIAVLTSDDSPKADKAITCKKLAIYGSAKAVPALKPLLADAELCSWARIALEAIPGPEADAALRDALGSLEGRQLIGAINSLGVRRDAKAVDALAGLLKNDNAEVASSAAAALGKIGGEPAAKVLRQSLADAPEGVRSAVAEGCVLCAEQFLADGKTTEAVAIYDEVRKAGVPKQRIVEATRGAILARGADGIPLLVEQLRSKDKKLFQIGLMTAREMTQVDVSAALLAELENATPMRGAMLMAAVADRGGATASPAILKAATEGPKPLRMAAVRVLQKSGDAACAPALLKIATDEDADLAETARTALAEFPGKQIDATIAAGLADAQGETLVMLMELVGRRRVAATPALVKALGSSDATVRQAALAALGETVELKDLGVLIAPVTSPKNEEDTATAVKALSVACARMPDGDACAAKISAAMKDAPVATKCTLLNVLGAMGGPAALKAIGTAGKDDSPELQDAATRVLGGWMSVDAGPVLLDLAKNAPVEKYRIRAIRGYIRLVRQFNMPAKQRVEMCVKALQTADRATEKKLVLNEVVGLDRYASRDMLRLAIAATKDPQLKEDAAKVAMKIAQKITGDPAKAKKLVEEMSK